MAKPGKGNSRFEDVFQEEIIPRFLDFESFKKFARSRVGLRLNEQDITEIIENKTESHSRELAMLNKWKECNNNATCDNIRAVVDSYFDDFFSAGGYKPLGASKDFGVLCDKKLGGRTRIFEGAQKTHDKVREIAVKILEWDKKTQEEANTLIKLESDSNVISYITSGKFSESIFVYLYIAMELCHEENLYGYITNSREEFDPFTSFRRSHELVKGLNHIHGKGIIHRDLKPHNVLLSRDLSTLKISDFGVSKQVLYESTTTQSERMIGTVGYKSPEAYNKSKYTFEGDIYSLAIVNFFIWSDGKHPFGDDSDKWNSNIKENVDRDFKPIFTKLPMVNKAVALLDKMMEFDPELRPTAVGILNSWEFPKAWDKREDWEARLNADSPCGNFHNFTQEPRERLLLFVKSSLADSQQSLCSFRPEHDSTLRKVQDFDKDDFMLHCTFGSVVVRKKIFLFGWDRQIFVTEPGEKSLWKKLEATTNFRHGKFPATAAVGDLIYIIGGGWSKRTPSASSECEMFDTNTNKCTEITSMNFKRRHNCVVAASGCIYTIGGESDEEETLKEVEKYNPDTEKWEIMPSLTTPRCKAAAAELNGVVYVLGGKKNHTSTLASVECLDTNSSGSIWTLISSMNHRRRLFRACVCESVLYVIGGDARSGAESLQITIEKLDKDQKWKKIKDLCNTDILDMNTVVLTL